MGFLVHGLCISALWVLFVWVVRRESFLGLFWLVVAFASYLGGCVGLYLL